MILRLLTVSILFGVSLFFVQTTSDRAFAMHTTRGAQYWYGVCKNPVVDAMIVEDCSGLVSNHDPYGQGLSEEGWRVAKCVAGGALLVWGGHPELIQLGPAVGCGTTTSTTPNNNDPLTGILHGLFGK